MFYLSEYDYCDGDLKYDDCGNLTVATLKIGAIKIPLCWDCVNELQDELTDFIKPQYCFQCWHWKPSPYGHSYDGSCCKDEDVPESNIGYQNCCGCMDKCKDFLKK